ncbi:hypothetical protein ZIOFF_022394 [Zingiber officinale]|uniref:DYW domain-containing protein n=1 Tax=Zingiber officinale TaxID=94328 RepID=A0A8J5H2T8_ZINOF|nr:hypothetical protein ZIOFF_022394 [Zingiber officinale]
MLGAGARPDYVTLIGLIFACSHAGLVESGRVHFESMEKVYGITPGPEHYSCMVDLLGRCGRVEEAVELLGRMDGEPDATVWKSLLAACRVHRNIPLAERAAECLFKLAPEDAVPYVMLANVYTAAGRWLDVARVRSLMRARGVSKEPGWSWMEEGGAVHAFKAGDRDHAQAKEIFAKVREMMQRIKEEGYAADTGFALHDEEEEGKAEELAVHSERLAVAFGLINSASHAYSPLKSSGYRDDNPQTEGGIYPSVLGLESLPSAKIKLCRGINSDQEEGEIGEIEGCRSSYPLRQDCASA